MEKPEDIKKKEPVVTSEAPVLEEMTMEQLLAEADKEQAAVGTVVTARVVEAESSGLLVDVGFKSSGFIPLVEFRSLPTPPRPGDTFPVVVKKAAGPEGRTLVSWKEARDRAAWPRLKAAKEAGETLEGKVVRAVKGGLVVDLGVEAFLPASQAELRPSKDLTPLVGSAVSVQVLELDPKKGNVVVSRRALLEKDAQAKRAEALKVLQVGQVAPGVVTGLTAFGAFVDMGGVEGLVRLPDISWRRISKPSEELKTGQKVEVKVLKIDAATGKVTLGRKQCLPHPWADIEARFPAGKAVPGKVTNVTDFGAFVRLEPGIEGLVHKSEFSWKEREVKPSDHVKPGQDVQVTVLSVNRAEERISLTLKKAAESPWASAAAKYPRGSKVKGVVARVTEFGAFVSLGDGIEGLLRAEDLSWIKRASPKEVLSAGQEVELKVLEVNPSSERLALGLKQMAPDPHAKIKVGAVVEGKVVRLGDHGAFVEILPGVEAFLHVSEISSEKRLRHPSEALKEGDAVTAEIIKVQAKPRRIDISSRKHDRAEERRLLKQYKPATGGVSLAEMTGWGQAEEGEEPSGGGDQTPS